MRRNKPITTKVLFGIINQRLKEQGLLPDILENVCPARNEYQINGHHWDTIGIVNFGTNEGIWLDLYCYYGNDKKIPIGSYKTLYDDKTAYKTMGELNAEFVFETNKYVRDHMDEFDDQ